MQIEKSQTVKENQLVDLKLGYFARFGKWLIERLPQPSTDSWFKLAGKVALITLGILACLTLALPTIGLSIALPIYCLYEGSRAKAQKKQSMTPLSLESAPSIPLPSRTPISSNPINNPARTNNITVLPPVGIENGRLVCYFNAAVQMIMNTPSFLEAANKLAQVNPFYKDLIEEYQKCQKLHAQLGMSHEQAIAARKDIFLKTDPSSPYGRFKAHMHEKHGKFPDGQEADMINVIRCFITDLINNKIDSPLYRKSYDTQNKTETEVNFYDIFAGDSSLDFGDELTLMLQTIDNFENKGPFCYTEPPRTIVTYENNLVPATRKNPLTLHLGKDASLSKEAISYACTFFMYRFGDLRGGHVLCCLKVNDTWYRCDDNYLTTLNQQDALNLALENPVQISLFERIT